MLGIKRAAAIDVLKASALYLGLGFSLGMYYTIAYYGRAGWPMPLPEGISALILYYFSVLNEPTVVQAIHWMVLFPVAGALWALLLVITAPFFGVRRPLFSLTFVRFGLTALPLTLAGPCMAFVAGSSPRYRSRPSRYLRRRSRQSNFRQRVFNRERRGNGRAPL